MVSLAISLIVLLALWPVIVRFNTYRVLWSQNVLFKDEGTVPAFYDKEYGVSGKPDRISQQGKHKYSIEYKSRKKGIFERDIVEALTAALAAYDKIGGIDYVLVYNDSFQRKLIKVRSKKALYRKVKKHVEAARKIKSGSAKWISKTKKNCPTCPYSDNCKR